MTTPHKPFYRLDEICARWQMSEWDIATYLITDKLRVAAMVAGLQVEFGTCATPATGRALRSPLGSRIHIGPIDLLPDDGWHVIEDGERKVSRFRAEPDQYVEIPRDAPAGSHIVVRRAALVFCQDEIDRFEQANGIRPVTAALIADEPVRRGARSQFDWDEFWVEVCAVVFVDGLPPSQGALVRQMDQWFAEHATKPPSTSTVKKKLIPLWRRINPEALANAPGRAG